MSRPPIALARLAGVVGGLIGLAVSDLVAWFLAPAAAPLAAVGSAIIDLLPAPLVNFGKETLGTADKPVLLIIITAGVLVLCAWVVSWSCAAGTSGGSSSVRWR